MIFEVYLLNTGVHFIGYPIRSFSVYPCSETPYARALAVAVPSGDFLKRYAVSVIDSYLSLFVKELEDTAPC